MPAFALGRSLNDPASRTRPSLGFQEWRDQEAWTERKYAMWERGEKLPSQMPRSS
jgi:hypothetical protein